MEKYHALFLDIDGTILKSDHTIEHSTKEAIEQAKKQGMEVFLATGRPLHEIHDIADELEINSLIGYNGAYAVYKNQVIVNEPLRPEIVDHYVKIAGNQPHEIIFYTNELNLLTSFDKPLVRKFIDYFDLSDYQLYNSEFRDQILGITFMNMSPADIGKYELDTEKIYFSQVNVKGLESCFDAIRESINKGYAVKKILDRLHIPPEEAIAFGDGMNDKEMLQLVGHGFAMGNASDELLAYAKHRTSSVDNSGIYNGLKQLGIIR